MACIILKAWNSYHCFWVNYKLQLEKNHHSKSAKTDANTPFCTVWPWPFDRKINGDTSCMWVFEISFQRTYRQTEIQTNVSENPTPQLPSVRAIKTHWSWILLLHFPHYQAPPFNVANATYPYLGLHPHYTFHYC